MINLAALKSEIQNDPENIGYAELVFAGRDQDVADLLNLKNRAGHRLVNLWEIKLVAIEGGFWPKIKWAASAHPVEQIKAVAATVLDYVDDRRFSTIDLYRESTQAMLAALVTGEVITQAESDALTAIADAMVSRVEQLFELGDVATAAQVGGCR